MPIRTQKSRAKNIRRKVITKKKASIPNVLLRPCKRKPLSPLTSKSPPSTNCPSRCARRCSNSGAPSPASTPDCTNNTALAVSRTDKDYRLRGAQKLYSSAKTKNKETRNEKLTKDAEHKGSTMKCRTLSTVNDRVTKSLFADVGSRTKFFWLNLV